MSDRINLVVTSRNFSSIKVFNYFAALLGITKVNPSFEKRHCYVYTTESFKQFYSFLYLLQQLLIKQWDVKLPTKKAHGTFYSFSNKKFSLAFLNLLKEERVVLPRKYGSKYEQKKLIRGRELLQTFFSAGKKGTSKFKGFFLAIQFQEALLAYTFFTKNFLKPQSGEFVTKIFFMLFMVFHLKLSVYLSAKAFLPYSYCKINLSCIR